MVKEPILYLLALSLIRFVGWNGSRMVTGCHLRWTKSHLEKASDSRPHGLDLGFDWNKKHMMMYIFYAQAFFGLFHSSSILYFDFFILPFFFLSIFLFFVILKNVLIFYTYHL